MLLTMLAAGCGSRAVSDGPPLPSGSHSTAAGAPNGQCVKTKLGCLDLETAYLPGVVDCELGRLSGTGAALEAQAIAARTYVVSYLERRGWDTQVRTNASFQCWNTPRYEHSVEAVRATAGVVMELADGRPIFANYVSGTAKLSFDCQPSPPAEDGYGDYDDWAAVAEAVQEDRRLGRDRRFKGTAWTQSMVTVNEGRRGGEIEPTPMSRSEPRNRGALSQRGAICLAENLGYETADILRYFYGDDLMFSRPINAVDGPFDDQR